MAMIDIEAQDADFQTKFEQLMYAADRIRRLGESIAWQEEEAEIASETFQGWAADLRDLQHQLTNAAGLCDQLAESATASV